MSFARPISLAAMMTPQATHKAMVSGGAHVVGPRPLGQPPRGMDGSFSHEKTLTQTGFHPHHLRKSLHGTGTSIGHCRATEQSGFLLPTDDRHAPIQFYRSFGEWFEAGLAKPDMKAAAVSKTSRYWPYGQDVTKLYQTGDKRHKYQLDDKCVQAAKPYVPPSPKLDLHRFRKTDSDPCLSSWRSARWGEGLDTTYHRNLRDKFTQWPKESR